MYDKKDTSTWTCLDCKYCTDGCTNWREEDGEWCLPIVRQRNCTYNWERSFIEAFNTVVDKYISDERGLDRNDFYKGTDPIPEPFEISEPTHAHAHMLCMYSQDHLMDRGHTCTRDLVDCPYPVPNSAECTAVLGEIMVRPYYDWKGYSVNVTVPYNRVKPVYKKKPWYKRLWKALCVWADDGSSISGGEGY